MRRAPCDAFYARPARVRCILAKNVFDYRLMADIRIPLAIASGRFSAPGAGLRARISLIALSLHLPIGCRASRLW
ncbi:hypothetical protein BOMU111920_04115 [Bordetella muralis]|jgi:hypothetical protein